MHRAPVYYPREALAKNRKASWSPQVKLDESGNVTDASILSGPDELRKPVLQSLLSWHFTKDAAGGTRQISITFHKPAAPTPEALAQARENAITRQDITVTAPSLPRPADATRKSAGPPPVRQGTPDTIGEITVRGLDIPAEELQGKLPIHAGDPWTPENAGKLTEAVRQIDEHLAVSTLRVPPAGVAVIISPRADTPTMTSAMAMDQPSSSPPPVPGVINVGGRVQAHKLISNPQPVYPTIARQARISGTVELQAVIGPDGHVLQLTVLSGHPLLRQASLDAVKQWVYEPTLLNSQPDPVATTIDVIYSISDN